MGRHKTEKRDKEMHHIRSILRRLDLARTRDWLKLLRNEQRTEYDALNQLCRRLSTSHKDSTPRQQQFRFCKGRFHSFALPQHSSAAAHPVIDPKGVVRTRPLSSKLVRSLVKEHYPTEWESVQKMRPPQLLYWLYEKTRKESDSVPETPLTQCITLDSEKKHAHYTMSETSEKVWGPILRLKKPESTPEESVSLLIHILSRLREVLEKNDASKEKKKNHKKRHRSPTLEENPIIHTRVLVLADFANSEEDEEANEDQTLGSEDSITSLGELSEIEKTMDGELIVYESGASEEEDYCSDDDVSYNDDESDDSEFSGYDHYDSDEEDDDSSDSDDESQ